MDDKELKEILNKAIGDIETHSKDIDQQLEPVFLKNVPVIEKYINMLDKNPKLTVATKKALKDQCQDLIIERQEFQSAKNCYRKSAGKLQYKFQMLLNDISAAERTCEIKANIEKSPGLTLTEEKYINPIKDDK